MITDFNVHPWITNAILSLFFFFFFFFNRGIDRRDPRQDADGHHRGGR